MGLSGEPSALELTQAGPKRAPVSLRLRKSSA
jgi:hypothetical protein